MAQEFVPSSIRGLQFFQISADQSTVVFVSSAALTPDDFNNRTDVYVQDLETGAIERIPTSLTRTTIQSSGSTILDLSINADGSKIAIYGLGPNLDGDIVRFDLETRQEIQVDVNADGVDIGLAYSPTLSPSGDQVYFLTGVQSSAAYFKDLNTGELTFLGPATNADPIFAPDGSSITYPTPNGPVTLDLEPENAPELVTTMLTFDDFNLLPSDETPLRDGYGGFDWTQAAVVNAGPSSIYRDGSGYTPSSGDNIAFIAEAGGFEVGGYEPAAGTALAFSTADAFNLNSALFAAAFRDDLEITVRAYSDVDGTTLIGTKTFQVDRDVLSLIRFDDGSQDGTFEGARRIEFDSNDLNGSTSDYFGFDDLTFTTPGLLG